MDAELERLFAPALVIVGLSHLLYPRRWADLFLAVKASGYGSLLVGTFTLPVGLLTIIGHNKWDLDWPVGITLLGWGMTIKAAIYLLVPHSFERVIAHGPEKSHQGFRVVGAVAAVYGGILTWRVFLA